MEKRDFPVTIKIVHEYNATIRVPACDQAEADRLALQLFDEWRSDLDNDIRVDLGLPLPLGRARADHQRARDRSSVSLRRLRQRHMRR